LRSAAIVPSDRRTCRDSTRPAARPTVPTPVSADVWQTLAWALAILAVFFPLAIALYQRRTTT
jgi:hypothetical protein